MSDFGAFMADMPNGRGRPNPDKNSPLIRSVVADSHYGDSWELGDRKKTVADRRSGLFGARKCGDALGKTRNFPARQILVNYAVAGGLHGRRFRIAERFLSGLHVARGDRFFN